MTSQSKFPDFDIPSVCPICMAHHEAMGGLTGQRQPEDGDANLCVVCKGLSVYDSSIPTKLRHPTDEELAAFDKDPDLKLVRWAMNEVHRKLGPPKGDYYPEE